jgi:tRNA pseudouridine55 synthase
MFYLIDKPLTISSFDVIRKMRKVLWIKRMWHAGTLDPLATWCLLLATGNSTKLLPLLEWSDKTYTFTVDISGSTPSLDLGTDITSFESCDYQEWTSDELREYLLAQTEQVPPRYSALHIDGKRAYELARDDIDFTIDTRPIQVKDVEILIFTPPIFTISLRISSGGYIRSLAPIIGRFFGTQGGYITQLRRTCIHTQYAHLWVDMTCPIDSIRPDSFITRELLFPHIQTIVIDDIILKQLQEWRLIPNIYAIEGVIWQLYFLDYGDSWSSLVEYVKDGFQIIRNDI